MTLIADSEVAYARRSRQLLWWRIMAIAALVGIAIALWGRFGVTGGAYIADLRIEGLITNDTKRLAAINALYDDASAKAVLVHIDSPGGTVVGGEALFKELKRLGERKPVVAIMGQLATSAGYMVAIAGERVFAHEGTITGSIGVLLQTTEITGLLEKIGVRADAIKSAPLKATPSPFEKLTPEVRRASQALVNDMFLMFREMVEEQRGMDAGDIAKLSDGRVFTGRQAVTNGLVDEIGGAREALAWLNEKHAVDPDLPIRPVLPERNVSGWLDRIESLAGKTVLSERLTLDGLISLWHPDAR